MSVGVCEIVFLDNIWGEKPLLRFASNCKTLAICAHRLMNSPVQFPSNVSLGAQMAG